MGWVNYWNRMEVGIHYNMSGYIQKHGKKGDPDLFAFVPVDHILWTMFFEVKREDGKGIQSQSQKDFENKFVGFDNVRYEIITDAKQIKTIVKEARMTSVNYGKLNESELPEEIGI